MKENLKKFINSKLFVFIITALVFSTIGVSAATYFPSNDVTYDNSTSGLSSTNVQGAIDELYNNCSNSSATTAENIIKNIVTSGDGLYKDEYEKERYIYRGANPNNYIIFNGELWRIISIESDKTIKIVKENIIREDAWDTIDKSNWARPATLNTYLNSTYYNTLNEFSKKLIVTHNWNIGPSTNPNNNIETTKNEEKSITYKNNIGLITISEYLQATLNTSCDNLNLAENNDCSSWITFGIPSGDVNNYNWTLTASTYNDVWYKNYIYYFAASSSSNYGEIGAANSSFTGSGALPVVYIKQGIKLFGTGEKTNPYVIIS